MCNIDKIIEMLDWNQSDEIQEKGIELAKSVKCINTFVLPMQPSKSVWENCAKILVSKTDQVLSPYLFRLIEWIKDLNWPGALLILERLKKFDDIKMLSFAVENSIKIAIGTNNNTWLDSMSELLENQKLQEALRAESLDILEEKYNKSGR